LRRFLQVLLSVISVAKSFRSGGFQGSAIGRQTPAEELAAFCDRLNEIVAACGQIKLVQVYTIARRTTEAYVAPLSNGEVDAIVDMVRARTGVAAAAFYAPSP
jgi:hypothetical protein